MGFVSVFQSTIIRIPVIEQVGFIIEAERTHTMGTMASQEKGDGNNLRIWACSRWFWAGFKEAGFCSALDAFGKMGILWLRILNVI